MSHVERRVGIRRSSHRPTRAATIEIKGRHIPVLAVDQSVRGIGIIAVSHRSAAVGARVLYHNGLESKECRVVRVDHADVAGTRVDRIGLEWID